MSNDKILEKYQIINGFYSTINNKKKKAYPVGYLDFHENSIFILSSRGILAFKNKLNNQKNFKQIKNNINEFISIEQFKKGDYYSLRDLFIHKNKIFVSFIDEIKKDCWNTSLIYGDINYKNITFKKLFSAEECVHSKNNIDKEFAGTQSGARIVNFDDNNVLLSIGEYRNRYLAQKNDSVNGKIIKINIHNNNYEIISMGHRNPQGLYFDKDQNFILETEHGPKGGDEINIISENRQGFIFEVDHIIDYSESKNNSIDNKQILCLYCHHMKTKWRNKYPNEKVKTIYEDKITPMEISSL